MRKQRKWRSPTTSGTYRSWLAMKGRCLDPNNNSFDYYGGRGIGVCPEWANDFDRFYADMGERPEGMTLDRRDNELGYSPSNCRWIEAPKQQANQRRTIRIAHAGFNLTLTEWALKLGVPYYTLWNRIRCHKMTPEKALTSLSLNRGRSA